jgi:nickel-type superoxide dismutase maturation protease
MAERMGDRDTLAQLREPPEGGPVSGKFGVVEVDGPSMAPTLAHGDRLLCHYGARVRAGSVVVAQHPLRQDLIVVKRAVERRDAGWWLLSDNSLVESDSRDYGPVPDDLILGRVLLRYAPKPSWLAPPPWAHAALRVMPYGVARRLGDFRRA